MKSKLFTLCFLSMIILSVLTGCSSEEPIPYYLLVNANRNRIREDVSTQQIVYEMGIGINLGNCLESNAGWDGGWIAQWTDNTIEDYIKSWGSPVPTRAMIQGYADAGFSSFRIPVCWMNLMDKSNNQIHAPLMNYVKQVVDWTLDAGMIAIINTHHEEWLHWYSDPAKYDEVQQRYIDVWTQVSEHFKNYGDRLIFENMNEVGYDDIWTQWSGTDADKKRAFDLVNELNQIFVDIVRASGGNNPLRHLLINVYVTGLEYAYDPYFAWPNDPADRYALSVHYYSPPDFALVGAGQDVGWAVGKATWGTQQQIDEVINAFDNLKRNVVDRGIPVIIGEYAVCETTANLTADPPIPNDKDRDAVRLWTITVAEAAYSRGMCPMLWDVEGMEYNRTTRTWNDPELIRQLMAIQDRHPR